MAFGPFGKHFRGMHAMNGGQFSERPCFEGMKESLGLPEDATQEQVREAMQLKRSEMHSEMLQKAREKLGLEEDSTDDEIQNALDSWREENIDLIMASGHGMHRGFQKPAGD